MVNKKNNTKNKNDQAIEEKYHLSLYTPTRTLKTPNPSSSLTQKV